MSRTHTPRGVARAASGGTLGGPSGRTLGGRLPPEAVFPAGRAGYDVRWLTLADGVRVRVVSCEPPDARPDAPVALFLHGWACSVYTWRKNLRAVADAGVRAVAFDLGGHGLSDKPLVTERYTVPAMVGDVLQVMDALGLERPVVVGHSMGGGIALRLAIDAPERVAALVLPAPVGFGSIGLMKVMRWITPSPVEAVLPYVTPKWAFRVALWRAYGRIGHQDPEDADEYWAPTRDPAFLRVLCRLSRAFDWTDGVPADLARVRCPTTVLFGGRDHLVRPGACRRYVECIPGVRWTTVADAGHTFPEELPDLVNAEVLRAARGEVT